MESELMFKSTQLVSSQGSARILTTTPRLVHLPPTCFSQGPSQEDRSWPKGLLHTISITSPSFCQPQSQTPGKRTAAAFSHSNSPLKEPPPTHPNGFKCVFKLEDGEQSQDGDEDPSRSTGEGKRHRQWKPRNDTIQAAFVMEGRSTLSGPQSWKHRGRLMGCTLTGPRCV